MNFSIIGLSPAPLPPIASSDAAFINEQKAFSTRLVEEIIPQNLPKIIELFESKKGSQINLNLVNEHGMTPLMQACHFGAVDIAKYLVDHQADVATVTDTKNNALTEAIRLKQCATVAWLCTQPSINRILHATNILNDTPIMEACRLGENRIINILLDAGADSTTKSQNGETLLQIALENKHFDTAKMIAEKRSFRWMLNTSIPFLRYPLKMAYDFKAKPLMKHLLTCGADPFVLSPDLKKIEKTLLEFVETFYDLFNTPQHLNFLQYFCSVEDYSGQSIRSIAKIYDNSRVITILDQHHLDTLKVVKTQEVATEQLKLFAALMFDSDVLINWSLLNSGGSHIYSSFFLIEQLIDYQNMGVLNDPYHLLLIQKIIFELKFILEIHYLCWENKIAEVGQKITQKIKDLPPYDPAVPFNRAPSVILIGHLDKHVVLYCIKRAACNQGNLTNRYTFTIINTGEEAIAYSPSEYTDRQFTNLAIGSEDQLNERFFSSLYTYSNTPTKDALKLIHEALFNPKVPNQYTINTHSKQNYGTCWVKVFTTFISQSLPKVTYRSFRLFLNSVIIKRIYPSNEPSLWKIAYPNMSQSLEETIIERTEAMTQRRVNRFAEALEHHEYY